MTSSIRSGRRFGIIQYNQNSFDPASGQAFAEMTVRARPRRHLSRLNPTRDVRRSQNGPESLEMLALREFLRYVEDITPETMNELTEILTHIPWNVGRKAWEEAQKHDLQSPLAVWRSFTAAYPGEDKIGYHRASTNVPDPDELPLYLERMNSDTFSWLTCLTLTEQRPQISFRRPDVINISRLRNLVALDVGSSITTMTRNELIDDSVVRSWARMVHETGSFPKLQVLSIRNQPGLTSRSLEYLNSFPSLTLFGIKECFEVLSKDEKAAKSFGWTNLDEHGVLAQVKSDITKSSTWDEPIRQCFKRASALLPSKDVVDAPLLNFRLGPTPSDILFNNSCSPLVFFRCLRCSILQNEAVVPVIVPPVQRRSSTSMQPHETIVKRRKLRRRVDLSGCLDEMLDDTKSDTTKSEAVTPTAARPHTLTPMEGWPDHPQVRTLSEIFPSGEKLHAETLLAKPETHEDDVEHG